MSIMDKFLNPFVNRISTEVAKKMEAVEQKNIEKSNQIQGLSLDPSKLFYRTPEKGLRKPTSITFDSLRRVSKAVHIARLCINTLKHRISQTEWNIVPAEGVNKPDEHHLNI